MNIKEIQKAVYDNAKAHGWWDGGPVDLSGERRTFGDIISLCHSELSEALEAYRNKEPSFHVKDGKPEGVATELADCVIRIFDYCESEGIDLEHAILAKHEYNKTRPFRHGGKVI